MLIDWGLIGCFLSRWDRTRFEIIFSIFLEMKFRFETGL